MQKERNDLVIFLVFKSPENISKFNFNKILGCEKMPEKDLNFDG